MRLPLTRPATGRDVHYKKYGQFTRARVVHGMLGDGGFASGRARIGDAERVST